MHINWQKDPDYTARFKLDEIYVKMENEQLVERVRIVQYPETKIPTVFYIKKVGVLTYDAITGEEILAISECEEKMSYQDFKEKYFNNNEAYEIINTIEDLF